MLINQDYFNMPSQTMKEQQVVIAEGYLRKIIRAEGIGDFPKKDQEIFALYRGTLQDGTEFDSNQDRENPFTFPLGQGKVIRGWDEGFATMRKGEKATLICAPDYAYGVRGSPPKIPPNATLHFEVQLLDFKDKKKEKWEYSEEEKVAEAKVLKESGNLKLKEGNSRGAVADYSEGIQYVEYETSLDAKELLKALRLNIAQAYIKLNKYYDAIDNCNKVLKDDPSNLKALYRRGTAFRKNQDFDKAQSDFKQLLKIDSANMEAKHQLQMIAKLRRQYRLKEKKAFSGLFSKVQLYDDNEAEKRRNLEKKKDYHSSDQQANEKDNSENKINEQCSQKSSLLAMNERRQQKMDIQEIPTKQAQQNNPESINVANGN